MYLDSDDPKTDSYSQPQCCRCTYPTGSTCTWILTTPRPTLTPNDNVAGVPTRQVLHLPQDRLLPLTTVLQVYLPDRFYMYLDSDDPKTDSYSQRQCCRCIPTGQVLHLPQDRLLPLTTVLQVYLPDRFFMYLDSDDPKTDSYSLRQCCRCTYPTGSTYTWTLTTPRPTLTPNDNVAGVPTRQVLHVPGR